MVTIEQQIACVRREVGMRKRVYANWVASGRMTRGTADLELEGMETVLATLTKLRDAEKVDLFKLPVTEG